MNNNIFNPKVSIIIPVYNGENYLNDAIMSALNQDYNNYEVIVVNDGSTDGGETERIALSYGDQIKYIYKENGGVSSALNCGIKNMSGQYFSWLSHDDKYTPNKLSNLVNILQEINDKRVVALTGVRHIDKANKKVKDVTYYFENKKVYSGRDVVEYMLKHGGLNGCALLIPKQALLECGGFNENLRYNQDLLMWYQIFGKGYKLVVDMEHKDVFYRLHSQQTSKTRRDLLLHDSLLMTQIVMPVLLSQDGDASYVMKSFAKRYAKHDCNDAVNEVIKIAKENNIFSILDIVELKLCICVGKIRNLMKKLFLIFRLK